MIHLWEVYVVFAMLFLSLNRERAIAYRKGVCCSYQDLFYLFKSSLLVCFLEAFHWEKVAQLTCSYICQLESSSPHFFLFLSFFFFFFIWTDFSAWKLPHGPGRQITLFSMGCIQLAAGDLDLIVISATNLLWASCFLSLCLCALGHQLRLETVQGKACL